jgi:hypothetical protein
MALNCSRIVLAAVLLAGCDVPEPAPPTGGVQLVGDACGRGLVVVGSNYSASTVALLDHEGVVRSSSVLSSGSLGSGISLPLSGDVTPASAPAGSGEIVLIDRFPNAVLTWLDPSTGAVRAQLSVATGFASNPQDYLEISPSRAYVSRLNSAPSPGLAPFDGGGDLLLLDPRVPAITGRIAFEAPAPYQPRPARLLQVGAAAWVPLLRMNAAFTAALDGQIVAVDTATDAPRWSMEIPGMANCGTMARSPGGSLVALSCSGVFAEGPGAQLARSGVVVLDARREPPVEVLRVGGAALGAPPSYASAAFLEEDRLLVPLYGDAEQGVPDRVVEVSLPGGEVGLVYEGARAFVLGDVRCRAPCSSWCFVADGVEESPGVQRLTPGPSGWTSERIEVAPSLGLPPRSLGVF